MDTLHSILFYVFAAVALAGALIAAMAPLRRHRAGGVGLVGLGLALLCIDLSAGFTALVTLVSYLTMAALLGRRGTTTGAPEAPAGAWHQAGAAGAAVLFCALAYAALSGRFHVVAYPGGDFGAAAVGRALVGNEGVAVEAVGVLLLSSVIGLALVRRSRHR